MLARQKHAMADRHAELDTGTNQVYLATHDDLLTQLCRYTCRQQAQTP